MKYAKVVRAVFVERLNRFVAKVIIDGVEMLCHVKNTGRCKEILVEGVIVYLEDCSDSLSKRKYRYSLISVEKETELGKFLINIDSQSPNKVVEEALESGFVPKGFSEVSYIRREYFYGNSRLDFYIEDSKGKKGLIEVKGVTLERDGLVLFPDAPTTRGVRHIKELIKSIDDGFVPNIIFVIQMERATLFSPNYETHMEFGETLKEARDKGVNIASYLCYISESNLKLGGEIPIKL